MPVPVACSCGKQLRVADEHRGKRIKCPGCGEPLSVPGGSSAKAPPAEMIRFECECGKLLQARPETAGKMTRCPDCGAKQEIPELEEAESRQANGRIQSEKPRPKKAVIEADEEEEDRPRRLKRDEEDEEPEEGRRRKRSKQKQRKKRVWPLVVALVAVLLLLLGGGGFAAYWFITGGSSYSETDFLPADAQMLAAIRLGEISKNDTLKKGIQKLGPDNPLEEAAANMGLTTADIERMTLVFFDLKQPEPMYLVVAAAKPYDQKKVLGSLSNVRAVKHEGGTYHVGQSTTKTTRRMPGGMPGAMPGPRSTQTEVVFFANKTVMVVAKDEPGMQRALSVATRKNKAGPLADAIRQITGPRHLFVAFALPPDMQQQMKGQAGNVPQMKAAAPLMEFTSGTVAVDYRSNVSLEVTLKFPDDKRAGDAKTAIDGLMTLASLAVLQLPDKDVQTAVQDALKKLKIDQRGAEVSLQVEVPAQTIEGAFNKAMPPGGFPGQ